MTNEMATPSDAANQELIANRDAWQARLDHLIAMPFHIGQGRKIAAAKRKVERLDAALAAAHPASKEHDSD